MRHRLWWTSVRKTKRCRIVSNHRRSEETDEIETMKNWLCRCKSWRESWKVAMKGNFLKVETTRPMLAVSPARFHLSWDPKGP